MAINIKKELGSIRKRPDMSTLVYGKIPPQAPELEEAVLGAILIERDALERAMGTIESPEVFYVDANRKIYQAMLTLYRSGAPIDLLTVTEQLRKQDELEIIGGAYYLTNLTENIVSGAHVENHCKIVFEKFIQREIIRICGEAIGTAYEDSTDAFSLLDIVQNEFSDLGNVTNEAPISIHDIATQEVRDVHSRIEMDISFTGIPTGFPTLDKATGGWQDTDLIIIAARPAVGKTAFVLNIAMNAAQVLEREINVAFFSLEMSKKQIGKRSLSAKSGVDLSKIYRDVLSLSQDEIGKLEQSASDFKNCRMFVNDRAAVNPAYVRRVSNELKRKKGLDMIIVDYLQIMTANGGKQNREREIASISSDLKAIAKDLNVPVIALSQLNRDGDGKPELKHLRESGAIEQDADLIAFLYSDGDEVDARIIFKIAKHRNGAIEDIPFRFEKTKQRFYDIKSEAQPAFHDRPDNPRAGIDFKSRAANDKPPF